MTSHLLQALPWVASVQKTLLAPSPVFGLPWMDVLGAPRLSIALDQVFRTVNPTSRPSFVSEVVAILTLVFAGDLVLPLLWPSLPPSVILTSATPHLLFAVAHAIFSRSAVKRLVPKQAGLKWEAVAAVFDGLTRAIVVCTLFVDTLARHQSLADNWFALIALAWVGVYGGALVVGAGSMWQREWALTTPPELKAGGWTPADFWVPPVFGALYLYLTRPFTSPFLAWASERLSFLSALALPPALHKPAHRALALMLGEHRIPWAADDARALVGVLLAALFVSRALWNFRGQLRWRRGAAKAGKKGGKGPAAARKLKTQ